MMSSSSSLSQMSSSPSLSSSSSFSNEHITINNHELITNDTLPNSTINSIFSNSSSTEEIMDQEWIKVLITVFTASIMIFIIVAAIFGNLLVIISVMRVRKLRYGLILIIMSTNFIFFLSIHNESILWIVFMFTRRINNT